MPLRDAHRTGLAIAAVSEAKRPDAPADVTQPLRGSSRGSRVFRVRTRIRGWRDLRRRLPHEAWIAFRAPPRARATRRAAALAPESANRRRRIRRRRASDGLTDDQAMATSASISTGMLNGNSARPTAERACAP